MKLSNLKNSGHAPTLLSAFLYFDISFMIWVFFGALGIYISKDFGLSPAEKGLLVGIPTISGSIFRIILGYLGDRFGNKRTAMAGMIVTAIPLIWGYLGASSISEIYAIGILLGVAGASFAVAIPMASRWYPPHMQGVVLGIAGAGNSGTVLATLFAPRIAEVSSWQTVFGIALIPLLIVFILFSIVAKEPKTQKEPIKMKDYVQLFKRKETWICCFLYSITFGGFIGLTNFLGIIARDQYAISPVQAGTIVTVCVAGGSLFRPLGGYLADRFKGGNVLFALFIVITTSLAIINQFSSYSFFLAFFLIIMICLGMGNGAVFQLVPQYFHKEIGTVTGLVGAFGGVGGFLLPNILGIMKQITDSYAYGYYAFMVTVIIGLLVLLKFVLKSNNRLVELNNMEVQK